MKEPSLTTLKPVLDIAKIKTDTRHRRNLGDVAGLAESIRRVGLLHPVVVSKGGVLIAGARRLEAVKRLGWKTVPVTIVEAVK